MAGNSYTQDFIFRQNKILYIVKIKQNIFLEILIHKNDSS